MIKIIKLSDVHFEDNVRTEALPTPLAEGSYTSCSDTHNNSNTNQDEDKDKTKTKTKKRQKQRQDKDKDKEKT